VQALTCRRCGTDVLVAKTSLAQTSVQWTDSSGCVELAAPAGLRTAVVPTCGQLRDSIESAVRAGTLPVPDL
jgi:hypothetical protein